MRTLPTQEEADDITKPFYPFFFSVLNEAMDAVAERRENDIRAGHDVADQRQFRAWHMYEYLFKIFTRRLGEHPELRLVDTGKSFGIIVHDRIEIWVKKLDERGKTAHNHTRTSRARLHNETMDGFLMPTLILGHRMDPTGTYISHLSLTCHGRDGEAVWIIDVIAECFAQETIPFEPMEEKTSPAIDRIMEIRAELKKNRKAGNE